MVTFGTPNSVPYMQRGLTYSVPFSEGPLLEIRLYKVAWLYDVLTTQFHDLYDTALLHFISYSQFASG